MGMLLKIEMNLLMESSEWFEYTLACLAVICSIKASQYLPIADPTSQGVILKS
jgi:hypothetical protein